MDMSKFSTANLNEPEPWSNRRSVLLGLPIAFLIAAWICVIGRLYTRVFVIKSPGWDDLFCGLYAIMTLVGTIAIGKGVDHGLGQHIVTLSLDEMNSYLRTFWLANASYTSSAAFIKLALLFQYLRVFERGTSMWMTCLLLTIFTALWGLAYSFIAWFPCFPVADAWDILAATKGSCYAFGSTDHDELTRTFESHTAVNMVLDLFLLLIAATLFWTKGTSAIQRVRLLALMVMGSLVIVFAAWRMGTIVSTRAATYPVFDPTWYGPISILLAVLEADTAAICASVPIFWPRLTEQLGRYIFVTQEVKITRETRYFEDDESIIHGSVLQHSRAGSETELKRVDFDGNGPRRPGASRAGTHYQDSYVMQQVDPLRLPRDMSSVEAQSGNSGRDHSRMPSNSKWTKL